MRLMHKNWKSDVSPSLIVYRYLYLPYYDPSAITQLLSLPSFGIRVTLILTDAKRAVPMVSKRKAACRVETIQHVSTLKSSVFSSRLSTYSSRGSVSSSSSLIDTRLS